MARPGSGDNPQAGSPWIDPGASAATLAVLSQADATLASNPGSLAYAFHGTGRVFLVGEPDALKQAHGYPTVEEAVGNSNSVSGLFGGSQDLAYLNSAGGKTGTPVTTGANQVVIAWLDVATKNDQASQGQSPSGPHRRMILSAAWGNSNVNGQGTPGLGGPGGSPDSNSASNPLAANPLSWLTGNGSALVYRGACLIGGMALLYLGLNRLSGGKISAAVRGTTRTAAKAIP